MPVSKRLRYEILKRDNHSCRYCGQMAPDAVLTVDHVTPVALGGTDEPSNLVAACKDCNAGKSSTAPDGPLVEDVKQVDLQWAGAIKRVAASRSRQRRKAMRYASDFLQNWNTWTDRYGNPHELPASWEASIYRFYDLGVPFEDIQHATSLACASSRQGWDGTFRYFAGCVWRVVTEMQEEAKARLAVEGGAN